MNNELQNLLKTLISDYGHNAVSMALYLMQNADTNIFEETTTSVADLPDAMPLQRLWQFCLYPGAVHLFVGEWGAGKSSILYNMFIHAAKNEPLWDVPFEMNRPLRILYIDRENSGQKRLQKLQRIGKGKPEFFFVNDGHNLNLSDPEQVAMLTQYILKHEIDLLGLDPLVGCFATVNENDNAEAQRQMASLITLAQTTGCAVLCVHHTDKANQGIGGRGATARIAAADVAYLLQTRVLQDDGDADDTFKGETIPREDIVRFRVTKNRYEGRGSLYLQMLGDDKFARSSFAAWRESDKSKDDAAHFDAAKEEVVAVLGDGNWKTRAQIYAEMAQEGFGQSLTDAVLSEQVLVGTISQQKLNQVNRYILSAYLGIEQGADHLGGWE